MKKLVLASLIALAASQAAGCIITSGDDSSDAYISANWQLKNVATNQTTPCPAGYDTAAVYNQPTDSAGSPVGQPIIDLFDCAAMSGTTAPLPPTTYLTWVEITTRTNTSAPYAKSLSAPVDVTVSDKTFSAQILNDGGYFQLQWGLVGANTNAPLTCAQAGAGGVEAVGTDVSTPSNSNSDIFDCGDKYGVTAGYRSATYTVSVAALGAGDASIGTAPALTNKAIPERNGVTNLGNIQIPITGM